MTQPLLKVSGLRASVADKEILKGLDLEVRAGEVHAIMGPNGSGKSTLANTLMGNPKYVVDAGTVELDGRDVLELAPDERARLGMFLAFQYPTAIDGVSLINFLRMALKSVRGHDIPPLEFRTLLQEKMKLLGMDGSMAGRYVNVGFSGGEKKRNEILQMALLEPRLALMDETDSGLDIDALRVVAQSVNTLKNPEMAVVLITHYQRLLDYITPDHVHVMVEGRIVRSGGSDLAHELEARGYDWVIEAAHTAQGV
ncbi:MAG: Fe-S cluster assembly ATPase SufC [Candidatus Dormibacteria bacterium]